MVFKHPPSDIGHLNQLNCCTELIAKMYGEKNKNISTVAALQVL